MALIVRDQDSKLQIQVNLGTDAFGKEIFRTKTYSKVKSEAQDEDLYEVANALIDLQEHPAYRILRNSTAKYEED